MAGRTWWFGLVAAMALGLVGPSAAEETPEDEVEADAGAANADAMFEYLVAEIASQRGDTEGAISVYERLARELKDPQIAKRAVETAIRSRASSRRPPTAARSSCSWRISSENFPTRPRSSPRRAT